MDQEWTWAGSGPELDNLAPCDFIVLVLTFLFYFMGLGQKNNIDM